MLGTTNVTKRQEHQNPFPKQGPGPFSQFESYSSSIQFTKEKRSFLISANQGLKSWGKKTTYREIASLLLFFLSCNFYSHLSYRENAARMPKVKVD